MPAREVIHYDHVITGVQELEHGVGADVAGATGHENAFFGRHKVIVVVPAVWIRDSAL